MILPELLHTVAYKDNTLGNPLLCPMDNLDAMTTSNIKSYIDTWYRPERIVISAVGADHEKVVDLTNKLFGDMKPSSESSSTANSTTTSSSAKPGLFSSLF